MWLFNLKMAFTPIFLGYIEMQKFVVQGCFSRRPLQKENRFCNRKDATSLKLAELPPLQCLACMPAFKQLKAKSACGMRYNAEWILNCMMLRISSPRAYKLISDTKVLPLPSLSRLTQILKGIPCKYGFNSYSEAGVRKDG